MSRKRAQHDVLSGQYYACLVLWALALIATAYFVYRTFALRSVPHALMAGTCIVVAIEGRRSQRAVKRALRDLA